jgi:hypothetical protein
MNSPWDVYVALMLIAVRLANTLMRSRAESRGCQPYWGCSWRRNLYSCVWDNQLIWLKVCFLAQKPPVGQGVLNHQVSRSHTTTHHSRLNSSGWVISPIWQHTTLTTDKHPCAPLGFNATLSADERPQIYTLDRAATGTGLIKTYVSCNRSH